MKSFAILLGAAACALATPAVAHPAASLEEQAATLAPSDWVWNDDGGTGPLKILVSLADQRAYVFRGPTMIAASDISSGRDGKETPVGTFPILQKQVDHKSTLYNAAPMPYMERLTWDGVAIHAGVTPGYRTSHGCIHVPIAFAKKLYGATTIGTVVEVTDAPYMPDMDAPQQPDADGSIGDAVYASATADASDAALASMQAD